MNHPCLYCSGYAELFVSSFLTHFLQKWKKCRACQPCTPATKSLIGKIRETLVPLPWEQTDNPIPSLSQSRLQRYRPIPVELWTVRPFCPVNPFSKTRGKSLCGIPIPLSSTDKITWLCFCAVEKRNDGCSVRYFTALLIIWFRMNRTHLSSI